MGLLFKLPRSKSSKRLFKIKLLSRNFPILLPRSNLQRQRNRPSSQFSNLSLPGNLPRLLNRKLRRISRLLRQLLNSSSQLLLLLLLRARLILINKPPLNIKIQFSNLTHLRRLQRSKMIWENIIRANLPSQCLKPSAICAEKTSKCRSSRMASGRLSAKIA